VVLSTFYFVGSGIAALAGAVYLIRDGGIAGSDIVVFEESGDFGGALDAHGAAETGYFMSGSRMFENKYNCTFDLLSGIPSATNPAISVTAETNRVAVENSWNDKARLVEARERRGLVGVRSLLRPAGKRRRQTHVGMHRTRDSRGSPRSSALR
jgi:myosin-crossreactive antigen